MGLFKIRNKRMLRIFLLVLLVLMCFNPYMIFLIHVPQLGLFGGYLFQLIFLFLLLVGGDGKTIRLNGALGICLFIQFLGILVSLAVHDTVGYLLYFITIILVLLLISWLEKTISLMAFFNYYNKWILLMSIGGVFVFIFAIIGIPPIYECISPVSSSFYISSWLVGFTNTYRTMFGELFSFVRYSGYFDEPGAMGYWGTYALVFNKLFFNNRKFEVILLILLLFTFSMGFFIQALIYVFLFYIIKPSRFRWPILITISLALLGIYFTRNTEYSAMYDMYFGRFDKMVDTDPSNTTINDARGTLSEQAKIVFMDNPIFGVGAKKWAEMPYMADNPYETLARDGIFGTIYWYMPYILLLLLAIKRRDATMMKLLIVLFLGFLHRPFQMTVLAFFITYSLLYLYERRNRQVYAISVSSNSSI